MTTAADRLHSAHKRQASHVFPRRDRYSRKRVKVFEPWAQLAILRECPTAASRRPGPLRRPRLATSSATPTDRRSHTSTMRRSRAGAGRRTCSPAMRPAGSPPTSPSCRSCCTRPRVHKIQNRRFRAGDARRNLFAPQERQRLEGSGGYPSPSKRCHSSGLITCQIRPAGSPPTSPSCRSCCSTADRTSDKHF
jgi:hypothetical protein